jgi:hypothetical protein
MSQRLVMHSIPRQNKLRPHDEPFRGFLHSESVRWAAAEGVSEAVIAATLLLHESSVDEILPELSTDEFEQVSGIGPSRHPASDRVKFPD